MQLTRRRGNFQLRDFAILAAIFLAFSVLNALFFGAWRLDLTDHRLYTLSNGSKSLIADIDEPVDLYLFFSERAARSNPTWRNYYRRVRELLEEYASRSGDSIRLQLIDPEPFSTAEERASEFGLQAVAMGGGVQGYFGLAGSNSVGKRETIAFFRQERESFLEYDISRMLYNLSVAQKPIIGIINGLHSETASSVEGQDWMILEQLRQTYEMRTLSTELERIDDDINLLLVANPPELEEGALYAIDQFVLRGGGALIMLDAASENGRNLPLENDSDVARVMRSDMPQLLRAWGVSLGQALLDNRRGIMVDTGAGKAVRHLGYINLVNEDMNSEDIVTAQLESVNLGLPGVIDVSPSSERSTQVEALMQSSEDAMTIGFNRVLFEADPTRLSKDFISAEQRYPVSVRITGRAESAFPGRASGSEDDAGADHIASNETINVILVADADMLADRFWVQVRSFYGQRFATPWAGNGTFVLNAIDSLHGGPTLIGIRSRGRFSRPFTVVQQLRSEAEAEHLRTAQTLEQKLRETQQKLGEIRQQQQDQSQFTVGRAQEDTIGRFREEERGIRRDLRQVRYQLNTDIERLGAWLKALNIIIFPLLMTALMFVARFAWLRMRRRQSPYHPKLVSKAG